MGVIESVPSAKLPETWQAQPSSYPAQTFGTRWLREYRNLALRLPSVVIPEEKSLLLNPRDPAIRDLKPGKPQAFRFDTRLAVFLLGVCFLREAPERANGSARRAGKWGLYSGSRRLRPAFDQ
jgi:hypothetical protein